MTSKIDMKDFLEAADSKCEGRYHEIFQELIFDLRKGSNGNFYCFNSAAHGGGVDNRPSLSIDNTTGQYKCFACGAEGNLQSYWTDYLKGTSSEDYIEFITKTAGINKLDFEDHDMTKNISEMRSLMGQLEKLKSFDPSNGLAAAIKSSKIIPMKDLDMWVDQLLNNKEKMDYLFKKRKITKEIIKKFKIGWYEHKMKTKAGKEFSTWKYIFPSINENGDVINIKAYDPESKNPAFKWMYPLKGMSNCLTPMINLNEPSLYFFEGQPDAYCAIAFGIAGAVTLGSSADSSKISPLLTKKQCEKYLKDKKVVICLDTDDSGRGASIKLANSILPYTDNIKIIDLDKSDINPYGLNPELLKDDGKRLETDFTDFMKKNSQEKRDLIKCFRDLEENTPLFIPKPIEYGLKRRPETLEEWERDYVMVDLPKGIEVCDVSQPKMVPTSMNLKPFHQATKSYNRAVEGKKGMTYQPLSKSWEESKNVHHYRGYAYRPGQGQFCEAPGVSDGIKSHINTFRFPDHNKTADGEIETFRKFLKHLFPIEEERQWIVKWLARMIQYPGVRSFVTPVNITSQTGTGRGLFLEIIVALMGSNNTHDVSKDDLEGRFNAFMANNIVAVVQEIKATTGKDKYQIWEKMKSMLADTRSGIQGKGNDSYTSSIYSNFIMFSNNIDALPLDSINERRIYAMEGPENKCTDEMIAGIVTWTRDSSCVASLFNMLAKMDVDLKDFNRAPASATKERVIEANLSDGLLMVKSWVEANPFIPTTIPNIKHQIFNEDNEVMLPNENSIGHFLRSIGYTKKMIKISGTRKTKIVWLPKDCALDNKEVSNILYSQM